MEKQFLGLKIFRNFPEDRLSLMPSKFKEIGFYIFGIKFSVSK